MPDLPWSPPELRVLEVEGQRQRQQGWGKGQRKGQRQVTRRPNNFFVGVNSNNYKYQGGERAGGAGQARGSRSEGTGTANSAKEEEGVRHEQVPTERSSPKESSRQDAGPLDELKNHDGKLDQSVCVSRAICWPSGPHDPGGGGRARLGNNETARGHMVRWMGYLRRQEFRETVQAVGRD